MQPKALAYLSPRKLQEEYQSKGRGGFAKETCPSPHPQTILVDLSVLLGFPCPYLASDITGLMASDMFVLFILRASQTVTQLGYPVVSITFSRLLMRCFTK